MDIAVIQDFIGSNKKKLTYLHNTSLKETADKIIKEGFKFEQYIENTADLISSKDTVALKYFLRQRTSYGRYTIVIVISKKVIEEYYAKLKSGRFHFSEVLSKKTPVLNSDDEFVFTLPEEYIKGYFNVSTDEIVKNPLFNPHYTHPNFNKNVDFILGKVEE